MSTVSIICITPFLTVWSAFTTVALLIITPSEKYKQQSDKIDKFVSLKSFMYSSKYHIQANNIDCDISWPCSLLN